MKKRILITAIILTLIFSPLAFSGTLKQKIDCKGNACILRLLWTTPTSGTFSGKLTKDVNGYIDAIETDPGTPAPTDNYDISIANKIISNIGGTSTTTIRDITGDTGTWSSGDITTAQDGVLANRDTANSEMTRLLDNGNYGGVMNHGPLQFDITNAGTNRTGVVNIFYFKTD